MSELLPCPFCGGKPRFFNNSDTETVVWAIECSHCSTVTRWLICKDTLRQLWNSRADMKEIIIKMIVGRIACLDVDPLLVHEKKFLITLAKLIESTQEDHVESTEA